MDSNILNIILLIIFLGLTAFFVAAEFAVVKIRKSRIDQLIDEGNKKAVIAKKVVSDLDYYLSACQLGITITAIGLGAFTKPYIKQLMYPVFEWLNTPDTVMNILSYGIALAVVSYLHVVIGEMAPKTLAIQFSEKTTLLLAPSLYYFGKVMYPFIKALNGTSRFLLRAVGVKSASEDQAYSEEELKIIMAQSFQGGEIDKQELEYMENVFTFDEHVVKDIMVPRREIIAIDQNMETKQIVSILDEHNYTRYPVVEENDKDKIIGFVNANKLLSRIVTNRHVNLTDFVRTIPFVFEQTSIQNALLKMQEERVHIAVVIDEYGGTAGILTMEDILEELVGEIRDEFDADEVDEIRKTGENEYTINSRVMLEDLEDRFGLEFEDSEGIDTIGGWALQSGLAIESEVIQGVEIQHGNHVWVIGEVDNYHIKEVVFKQNFLKQ
ncbi:transporter associated domain protein [Solibacillus sp. R5-41]|uniref:hemolysin family protein n=1 Tax=Solibacillus sp. R5-41 TaxID=2048654 RepID=UPI000C12829C|nr:hemolysin family protein [Solibacillus sp. R5-41]ATP39545.1 transporter associated domain protein [Solibacillus sp. R5-41]